MISHATSRLTGIGRRAWGAPAELLVNVLVGLLLIYSYFPVFALYARQQWSTDSVQGAYQHAPLALLMIVWLAWRRRGVLARACASDRFGVGLIWLFVGVAMKLYGDIHGYDVMQGLSLVPTLAGLVLARYGRAAWRALRFPISGVLLIIPLPSAAIDALTQPLLALTGTGVRWLLPVLGLDDQ